MALSPNGTMHRSTVTGMRGMVASAHPLASLAGMRMLLDGGNAFDAAVAVAAALNVVEPYMSGIGGAGYALVHQAGTPGVRVLDYCGRTPRDVITEAFVREEDREGGVRTCLVPGACGGWLELLERCGRMDRAQVFEPAIELAEGGYAVTVKNAAFMGDAASRLRPTGASVILSRGRAPLPGEVLVQKGLARSFRRVVEGGAEVFYQGDLAREMVDYVAAEGGFLTGQDLAEFQIEWMDPVSTTYRGHEVYCPPPPCSGFQILQALNMLESYPIAELPHGSEPALHTMIEVLKVANADRVEYAAAQGPPIDALLSKAYAERRRKMVGDRAGVSRGEYYEAARLPGEIEPGKEPDWIDECTTHFDVVDGDGNAVAITQSLGAGFGCGAAAGDTGIFLNNFIKWTDAVPGSPNCVGPHKKIDMCLSPCQVFRGDALAAVLGTPGSWGIQQTTTQILTNYLDYDMNIQAAIEAPRFRFQFPGTRVSVEDRVSAEVRSALEKRGHQIDLLPGWSPVVGGAQGIVVDPESGALMGGADPRRDGYVLGL